MTTILIITVLLILLIFPISYGDTCIEATDYPCPCCHGFFVTHTLNVTLANSINIWVETNGTITAGNNTLVRISSAP